MISFNDIMILMIEIVSLIVIIGSFIFIIKDFFEDNLER